MKLLTKEITEKMPKLYGQGDKGDDAIAFVKFFCPWNSWTWYATEYEDGTFFGLVKGSEAELGYFTLGELQGVTGPMGLKIERDLYFKPCKLSECETK